MCTQIENTARRDQNIARQNAEYAYRNRRWTYTDIYDAYSRPSREKIRAWEYCQTLCADVGGWDLIISSRNTFRFSAVFKFEDPETGALCYGYITADYNRYCYADAAVKPRKAA